MSSLRYRTIKNKVFFYTTCFLASLTVIPLFAIIWELIKKGYKQINWNFFTESAPSTLDAMLARGTGRHYSGRNCKRDYRYVTHGLS